MKENFNISVGKLKKYFKAEYLLEVLRENDRFITPERSPVTRKGAFNNEENIDR